jgi:hypothetical protein
MKITAAAAMAGNYESYAWIDTPQRAYGIPSFRNRNQRQRRRDHRRTRPHGWKGGAK